MAKICTTIWKDITGYEGLYQVSNTGKVRSFHKHHLRILSDCVSIYGYKVVLLHDGMGHRKNARVHRLVADAFLPNPLRLPYVNHKDEDKSNNNVENLEWCNAKYNSNYGTCQERKASKHHKKIIMYDIDGNFLSSFKSLAEAEKITGYKHECISRCCSGKILSYKNRIWLYNGQEDLLYERINKCKVSNNFHRVARCDMNGNILQIYPNVSIAVRESNTARTQIDRQINKNIVSKNSKWLWKIV